MKGEDTTICPSFGGVRVYLVLLGIRTLETSVGTGSCQTQSRHCSITGGSFCSFKYRQLDTESIHLGCVRQVVEHIYLLA